MKNYWFAMFALAAATIAGCGGGEPAGSAAMPGVQAPAEPESRGVGVIQSVDTANGKVTIAHEPIEALGWPAMTMGFSVARPELLTDVKSGQRVDFTLRGRDMSAVITSIKPAE